MKNRVRNLDIVGKKINMLTVIEKMPFIGGRSKFKCICECGNIKILDGPKLNHGNIKSCGCLRYRDENKKAYGLHHRKSWGESLKNGVISMYKGNALSRNIEFLLTIEQMETFFKSKCFYCGRPPYKTIAKEKSYGTFTYTGIDRLDNTKGYIIDNTVPCCSECNYLKNSYNLKDFLNIIRSIYENTKLININ